ncbi:MAG: hypothetical protein IT381_30175 [Deltaproteobacteria bacterium]|nr:hypothetical protein [Deltaproteobacteria bacterium]
MARTIQKKHRAEKTDSKRHDVEDLGHLSKRFYSASRASRDPSGLPFARTLRALAYARHVDNEDTRTLLMAFNRIAEIFLANKPTNEWPKFRGGDEPVDVIFRHDVPGAMTRAQWAVNARTQVSSALVALYRKKGAGKYAFAETGDAPALTLTKIIISTFTSAIAANEIVPGARESETTLEKCLRAVESDLKLARENARRYDDSVNTAEPKWVARKSLRDELSERLIRSVAKELGMPRARAKSLFDADHKKAEGGRKSHSWRKGSKALRQAEAVAAGP